MEHQDDHCLYWNATDSLIQGNRFYTPTSEWNIQNVSGATGNVYDRNVFMGGGGGCITVTGGSNVTFTNNICYAEKASHTFTGKDGNSYTLQLTAETWFRVNGIKAYNNTWDGGQGGSNAGIFADNGDVDLRNNIYCGIPVTLGSNPAGSNHTTSCTGFTNRGSHDYTLTNGATAMINLGTTPGTMPYRQDCQGNTRSDTYDIGACEFGGGTGTPVATSLGFVSGRGPSSVATDTAMSPSVQVEVLDQFGAHINASALITLALSTNPWGATLSGGGETATVNGTATFPGLMLNQPGTGYVLTASALGLTNAVSSSFAVTGPSSACSSPCTVYVSSGALDDSRACNAADITHPRKTIAGGLACLTVPGSTLYLRAGNYDECIDTGVTPFTGGTSYASGQVTTIAAYASETVTLRLPPACQALVIFQNAADDHYIILDRLILDSLNTDQANGLVYYPGTHHIRFQNGVIRNTFYEGVYIQNANDTEVLNSTIEQSNWYGINVVGSSTRTFLQGLTIRNHAQSGLQITNGSTFTARNLTLTGNGVGGSLAAVRVGGSGTAGALLANAVIYENYAGIEVLTGTNGLNLYNETIVNNTTYGVTVASGAASINLTNSISTGHGTQNVVNNAGASLTQAAVLTTNPGFVDVATDNYKLAPTATTALDQGITLTTDVPTDRDGVPRPQGAGYDIGAYECPAPCTGAPPPSGGVQLEAPAWKSGGLLRR